MNEAGSAKEKGARRRASAPKGNRRWPNYALWMSRKAGRGRSLARSRLASPAARQSAAHRAASFCLPGDAERVEGVASQHWQPAPESARPAGGRLPPTLWARDLFVEARATIGVPAPLL